MDRVRALHWPGEGPPELAGQGAAMKRVAVRAGHVAARHSHPFEQFLFVASGGGRLQCEAGEIALDPGTALHLPAHSWHSAEFTSETVLIELNMAEASAR